MRFKTIFIAILLSASTGYSMGQRLPGDGAPAEVPEGVDRAENLPRGPFLPVGQKVVDLSKYDHLDPQNIVPDRALSRAVSFYDANQSKIKNKRWVTIADFSKHASKKRLFVIDMQSGSVFQTEVSVGRQSDSDGDGWATSFSNVSGSNKSSLGFYLTGGPYQGSHGLSMYLHGLESSNSNAYSRAIVMHGADYVYSGHAGRSLGCPAIAQSLVTTLIPKLQSGSLLYVHYNQ